MNIKAIYFGPANLTGTFELILFYCSCGVEGVATFIVKRGGRKNETFPRVVCFPGYGNRDLIDLHGSSR